MRKHLWIVALTGIVLAAGCGTPQRATPAEPQALPAGSFARQWTAELNLRGDTLEQLHIRPELVFAYTQRRHSHALNRAGGHLEGIHVLPRETRVHPPLLFGEQFVYPTSTTLEVFDRVGRRVESIQLPRAVRSGAVVNEPYIYIGLDYPGGGRIAALDMRRGYSHAAWERMTRAGVSATPAVHDDVIFVGSEDGRLYAIQEDGDPAWAMPHGSYFATGDRILGDVQADLSGVYVASTDFKLYCLERATGRIQWIYFTGTPLTTGPVVTDDLVYQLVPGRGLAAIDKETGQYHRTPRWIAPNAVRLLSQDRRHAYVQRRDNRIAAIDKQSGEVRWESARSDLRIFATNVHDEIIYAGTPGGDILAIRPVIRAGTVGELVLELIPMPLAMGD